MDSCRELRVLSGYSTLSVSLFCTLARAKENSATHSIAVSDTGIEKQSPNADKNETMAPNNSPAQNAKAHSEKAEKAKARPSAQTPNVYIISPKTGETVSPTFKAIFSLSGMGIAPAGVIEESTGHHHLLINVDELAPLNRPLPSTENIIHFGAQQTENWVALKPENHTLQLLLGNFAHIPRSTPLLPEKISINSASSQ